MAQLLSFTGMPNIPGFQFWAVRGRPPGPAQVAPTAGWIAPGTTVQGIRIYLVTCIANTVHAIVGAIVTVQIAGTTTVSFKFTETTAPGFEPVVVANNATAAQCATALGAAITNWATANMPLAIFGGPGSLGPTICAIGQAGAPQIALRVTTSGPPVLAVTNNGGRMYGDILLRNASRAFVYTGYDPLGLSAFPNGPGGSPPDVAFMFLPLTPVIPKAFPSAILNPIANEKPEG